MVVVNSRLAHGAAHAQHRASRADTVVGSPTAKAPAVDVAVVEDVAAEVWSVVAAEAEAVPAVDLHQAQLPVVARLRRERRKR